MIDTERAAVDLKTSVNRLRFYIKKLKQSANKDNSTLRLADHFQFELGLLNKEAREAFREVRNAEQLS